MIDNEKIGVGVITCNRPKYLQNLLDTLKPCQHVIDELVVVNDGSLVEGIELSKGEWINNSSNLGVAKTKNKALKYLFEKNCKYIFLIEDDVTVKNKKVFEKYIEAFKKTGIRHFNYGPGTPFNRKQDTSFDIHNRHDLSSDSEPNPKIVIDYGSVKIALYEHVAGMFSFFERSVLESVGFLDERFYNAWEHVEHTYRIIKAGFHPPFWWFADIADSTNYISEFKDAIQNSAIAKNSELWMKSVYDGRDLYLQIHGHYPNQPPPSSKEDVVKILKKIKNG